MTKLSVGGLYIGVKWVTLRSSGAERWKDGMLHVLPVRQHPHIRHYSKHPIMCIKGGLVDERETEMMSVRWNQFTFTSQITAS